MGMVENTKLIGDKMEKTTTINYILKNDLKIAELKILNFLYHNKRCKKTHIERGCEINFYQVKLALPKLIEIGLVIEKDKVYSINNKNPIVIKLFEKLVA